MVFAQINNDYVKNVIVLDDESMASDFSAGFQAFVRIDLLDPMPGINWNWDGVNFSRPIDPSTPDPE
jgi:hypothetical protein